MAEEKKHREKSSRKYGYWIVGGIALVILIGILLVVFTGRVNTFTGPTCQQVSYEEQEEYMKTEYYTESVPYTDQECENKRLVYKKSTGSCQDRQSGLFGLGDQPAKYSCTITNLDNEGGTFSVEIGFDIGGQRITEVQSRFIYPQSSATFSYERDVSIASCVCGEEDIPTKQVCRDVIKYNEVQRERQVTAYRPVTKYRQECN